MHNRSSIQGVLIFLAGMLTASVLAVGLFYTQPAQANNYSCIRTDLKAYGMTGNIPDSEFTLTYKIPFCLESLGYQVQRVYIRDGQVAVHYKR